MDTLISFDDLKAGAKALKKLAQAFMRAGTPVASTDVDPKTKRTSGVNYRQVLLTFADNQKVQLGVKTTGDIFEVKVNGSVLPIKAQDDQRKAVAEIVKALDAGRAKFQAKLARQKVALPKGITTAAPKMEQKLAQASADLDAKITTAKARVNELRAELGEPVLDAAKKTGFMAFNVDSTNKFTVYVKVEDGMSDKDARSDAIEAARAELGGGATRVKDGGRRVSKVPADAWEAGKAKGWAWFAKGHLSMPALDSAGASVLDAASLKRCIGMLAKADDGKVLGKVTGIREQGRKTVIVELDGKRAVVASDVQPSLDADAGGAEHLQVSGFYSSRALDAVDVPTNTFDNPDVLAAQQIAQQVNGGMALDDAAFPHALATLYIALDTVETNHPINLAEGNLAQAELEERAAEDFRAAIKALESQQVAA